MRAGRRQSRRVGAAAALGLLALAGPVAADPNGTRTQAETCFEAAEAAQPLLKSHSLVAAQRELLQCAREGCPRAARNDCETWLQQLAGKMPTVVFRAREARPGGDIAVDDVRVTADGELLIPQRLGETPVALDPGRHVLTFEHGVFPRVEQRLELHEGDSRRVVDVVFRLGQPVPESTEPWREPGDKPASEGDAPVPPIAWTLLGGSVLAFGVGTYFEIAGLSARSHLYATCQPTQTCARSDVDSARGQVLAGDVALGLGTALLAGAAYFYFTRGPATAQHDSEAVHLRVGPIAGGVAGAIEGAL